MGGLKRFPSVAWFAHPCSRAMLKSKGDNASPCLRPQWIGKASESYRPTRTLLIYHSLPNVWKASYTISASIFVDVPYWPSYSTDKFVSCVVPGSSQRFFHFGKEIVIAWSHIGWVRWMFQNLPFPAAQVSVRAAVWRLAYSWIMLGSVPPSWPCD